MQFDQAFFDGGIERRGTSCIKWDLPDVLPEGAIPLWVADMDFPCAPAIQDAALERAQHACYGYNAGNPDAEKAFCGFWQRRHGLRILPEQTRMLPCVVTGLKTCVRAFTKQGDSVALMTPVYGPFYESVRANGREVVEVPLLREEESGRYAMDLSCMERALQGGVRLVFLCNPHNPVSRAWTKEELTELCALIKKYDALIVSDEIHADFVYAPGRFVPLLSLPEARDCAVMLCAASKTFNVAGLQQATAVSMNPALLACMEQEMNAAGITCGNTFALCATRAAYEKGDAWLEGLMAYLDENRRVLSEWVKEYLPKARLTPIEATYLAWLDLRAYGKSCEEMDKAFTRHGVVLTAGDHFGTAGAGFMRLNFGCPRAALQEGIKRIKDALEE